MYMHKFSQAELLNEAFADLIRGAAKAAGRGALAVGKGIAKTISPTGYNLVKQAGETAGKVVAGIALEDPKTVLKSMLASSEGKKTIQNGKIGAEKELNGGYRQIELTGEWISDPTQPPTPFKTNVFLVKNSKNEWDFAGGFDTDGNFIFNKGAKNRRGAAVPTAVPATTPPAAPSPPAAPTGTQQANTEIGTKVKWQTARGNVREGEIIENDPGKNIDTATHISIQEPDGKVNIVRKDKVIKESMTHINLIESTKLENIFKFT